MDGLVCVVWEIPLMIGRRKDKRGWLAVTRLLQSAIITEIRIGEQRPLQESGCDEERILAGWLRAVLGVISFAAGRDISSPLSLSKGKSTLPLRLLHESS